MNWASLITYYDLFSWRNVSKLFAAMALLLCTAIHTQAQKPKDISKEAAQEAKALKKEGWQTSTKTAIEEQVEHGLQLLYATMENETGEQESRYIIATSEASSKNQEIANAKVRAQCEAQLAQSLEISIKTIIDREVRTQQMSATEAETNEQTTIRARTESKKQLGLCEVVRHFSKKNTDGTYTVQMTLAYDKKKLHNK